MSIKNAGNSDAETAGLGNPFLIETMVNLTNKMILKQVYGVQMMKSQMYFYLHLR